MYEHFYGLKENPFNVTPNPEYIFLGENHREALAQLLYGVREKKGFIVITGEVGAGKTTLIHYLLEKIDGNGHTKTAFLFNPKLTVNDFIQYILEDLGVRAQGQTKGEHLHNLHRYLLNAYRKDERVVLIVDEAHGLSCFKLYWSVNQNWIKRYPNRNFVSLNSVLIYDTIYHPFLRKKQKNISKRG
jgi:general secretion pathway protein A